MSDEARKPDWHAEVDREIQRLSAEYKRISEEVRVIKEMLDEKRNRPIGL